MPSAAAKLARRSANDAECMAIFRPRPHAPKDCFADGVSVSFEFFPPKTPVAETQLWQAIRRLAIVRPAFMSVTYGAGGSTRDGTHRIVKSIQTETGVKTAAHLTCVDAARVEIDAIAESYWASGIRHLVALRGDAAESVGSSFPPRRDGYPYEGYPYADALVHGLRRLHPFEISVAAYPEIHPQAASAEADLDALKRKIDAGATRAITQFFFDVDKFEHFVERVRRAGINIPIVPGILPVTNFAKAADFAHKCNVHIPDQIRQQFEGMDDDPETLRLVAASVATEQCRALRRLGINHFHFYTLNRAELSFAICHMLDVRPAAARLC
jgi:methylenetetrahydrofolate reductase (NADPH)